MVELLEECASGSTGDKCSIILHFICSLNLITPQGRSECCVELWLTHTHTHARAHAHAHNFTPPRLSASQWVSEWVMWLVYLKAICTPLTVYYIALMLSASAQHHGYLWGSTEGCTIPCASPRIVLRLLFKYLNPSQPFSFCWQNVHLWTWCISLKSLVSNMKTDSRGKEAKENCILCSFVPPFVET